MILTQFSTLCKNDTYATHNIAQRFANNMSVPFKVCYFQNKKKISGQIVRKITGATVTQYNCFFINREANYTVCGYLSKPTNTT